MKYKIELFLLLLVIACKSKINSPEKDCFYENKDFIYLNFSNSTEKEKLIPNLTGIIDNNFYLLSNNYRLVDDTLQIKFFDERNIRIADTDSRYSIKETINYIKLKKGTKTQQTFKIHKNFNVVSLLYQGHRLNIERCK